MIFWNLGSGEHPMAFKASVSLDLVLDVLVTALKANIILAIITNDVRLPLLDIGCTVVASCILVVEVIWDHCLKLHIM